MQEFQSVLVGVDLSSGDHLASTELGAPTREAIRRGIWAGQHLGATVTFFAALDVSARTEELLHDALDEASRNVEQTAREVINGLVKEAEAQGVSARGVVVFGNAWEAITKEVLREKHNLVVVGTRRRGTMSRLLIGSTSRKLLRFCPCPVWVTRPDPDYSDVNMLVACDLGPETPRLLRIAVGGGRLLNAKVHLAHAVERDADQGLWTSAVPGERLAEHRSRALAEAEEKLREYLARSDFRTLPFGVQIHVVEGDADDVLLDLIEKHGIDLLVMGTQARRGLPGVFLGNTAERMLSQVQCSVFVIKPEGFVSPVTFD